jgi:hypothetical protein
MNTALNAAQQKQMQVTGMTFGTISIFLFIVFLILKSTDKIKWSWWWVTSPLWMPIIFSIVIAGYYKISGMKKPDPAADIPQMEPKPVSQPVAQVLTNDPLQPRPATPEEIEVARSMDLI